MKSRLPQGYGQGPSGMQGMLRQAQKMQEQMEALREQLDVREYEVKAGGGMVTVRINGKKEIIGMEIKPEIVDPDDVETLTDIVIAAVNEAIKTVEQTNEAEMAKITGGLPGLF